MTNNPLEQLHVLVVEDAVHMQTLIKAILHGLGVGEVSLASDGAEGLQILRTRPVDIVFCDIKMDVLDGLEMVRMIRTAKDSPNPHVPIIMLTGRTTMADVVASRNAGATEFLAKPVTAEAIYSRIAYVIEHPRQFVKTKDYCGPDRRRRINEMYFGEERRTGTGAIVGSAHAQGARATDAAKIQDEDMVPEDVAGHP